MDFHDWSGEPGDPGRILDLRASGALDHLLDLYGRARPEVLSRVLAQAYALGGQMAVIEYRYLDPDYRNEHSRFYSGTFRRYPSVAHRLHFFSEPPPAALSDTDAPARFRDETYLGYCVIRPVPGAPVGRTMLRPPRELEPYVSCRGEDHINLFGGPMSVDAAPFIAQDAQLIVCAHATVWITAYYHHLRFGAHRFLPGEIADAVPSATGLGRPTPSEGLTIQQLTEASRVTGLPCLVYPLRYSAASGAAVYASACRYLNSGLPVIIAGGGHAFTLVGYQPYTAKDGSKKIRFIRQDDEVGPYQTVENPLLDDYAPWEWLVAPLPPKVYVSGEKAEALGIRRLRVSLAAAGGAEHLALLKRLETHAVRFRTTVLKSNDFKTGLTRRGLGDPAAAIYERMGMSKRIWVVEATDAEERDKGNPCVIAEAVMDATDHLRDQHVLAWRIPGTLYQWLPDDDTYRIYRNLPEAPMLESLCQVSQRVV